MKKLFIFTFLTFILPSVTFGETYVFAFQCFLDKNKICQLEFKRTEKGFEDEYGRSFTTQESTNSIALSLPYDKHDGTTVFSAVINKKDNNFALSVTQLDHAGTGFREGTYSKIY